MVPPSRHYGTIAAALARKEAHLGTSGRREKPRERKKQYLLGGIWRGFQWWLSFVEVPNGGWAPSRSQLVVGLVEVPSPVELLRGGTVPHRPPHLLQRLLLPRPLSNVNACSSSPATLRCSRTSRASLSPSASMAEATSSGGAAHMEVEATAYG